VISRALLTATLVASALLLVGCTAPAGPPAEPSAEEVAAAVRVAVDRQWEASGLEGRVERPAPPVWQVAPVLESGPALSECLQDAGISSWGYSDVDGLSGGDGTRASDEEQLVFYNCYARFPQVLVFSAEQRAFIYDYYARLNIPCLGFHGYGLSNVPSRESFVSGSADFGGSWLWSPMMSTTTQPDSDEEWERLERDCPSTVPGIEGWSYTPIFG